MMKIENLPKRIVISRKGFDSSAGGCASPILQDGTMVSLPIPECGTNTICKRGHVRYRDLGHVTQQVKIADLVSQLSKGRVSPDHCVHLDPDIRPEIRASNAAKEAKSICAFGQDDSFQVELSNRNVTKDDLFLYFGWFRRAEVIDGKLLFVPGAPNIHALWGWMQVKKQPTPIPRERGVIHDDPCYRHHPHVSHFDRDNNFLYEASLNERLSFRHELPAVGVFKKFCDELSFTNPGGTRGKWRLPRFFADMNMSHFNFKNATNELTWDIEGDYIVAPQRCKGCGGAFRGQEFIFDTAKHSEKIGKWLTKKFDCAADKA